MQLKRRLYHELIAGRTVFDWCFLLTGLLIQVLVFRMAPDHPVMIVSGIAGIFSVILCSQGKISTFFFGFIQVLTYLYIAYLQRLYAEVAINVFYFVTMIYGVFEWRRHYHVKEENQSAELTTKRFPAIWWGISIVAVVLLSWLVGWLLATFTNDTDPYLDAFTTVPAILAQMLMVWGYREQWFFWLCIDLGCTWMWVRADNWSMAALYAFWCINCVYGFLHWTTNSQPANQ